MIAERKVKSTMQRNIMKDGETNRYCRRLPDSDQSSVIRQLIITTQDGKDKTLQVFVRDNNVDQALRVLKKKMQREGIFREMKRRRFFEKPSERSTREKAEAVRRARKLARKQAIREGLIAAPKKAVSQSGTSSAARGRAVARY
jgi:small subunit ribosomal protein S21